MGKRTQQEVGSDQQQTHIHQLIECLRLIRLSVIKTWDRDQNFGQGLDKSLSQHRDALDATPRIEVTEVIKKETHEHNLYEMISEIYKQGLRSETLESDVLRAIAEAFEESTVPEVLLNLLLYLADHSELLMVWLQEPPYIQGIAALANHHESWLRSPEQWRPTAPPRDRQFSELARHLLAAYDVPRFMDQVWFQGNPTYQEWFKHIGAGRNIRTAPGLPLSLTQKMAHYFLTAPEDYTLEEAFRWAQVHALGGDSRLANALRGTKLTQSEHDFWKSADLLTLGDFWGDNTAFWMSVIHFFITNPMLDIRHVGPIIDYIWHQKYGKRDGMWNPMPNQPNFTMRRRTPENLLRRVAEWHEALDGPWEDEELDWDRSLNWDRSKIGEFCCQEAATETDTMRSWSIRELLSSEELIEEGRALQHCVRTYAHSCHTRSSSIWRMETQDPNGRQKVLTIEVLLPQKRVSQVRGNGNRFPTSKEKSIIKKWADAEGLQLATYIQTVDN